MKTTEELRAKLRELGRNNAEIAAVLQKIDDKQVSWDRAALHLFLSIADDSPAKPSVISGVSEAEKAIEKAKKQAK